MITNEAKIEPYSITEARIKRLKSIWRNMNYRCYGKHLPDRISRYYRDKGITICKEWRDDFGTFYDWAIKAGYENELSIDRIDPNNGYSPNNCRWIPISENSRRAVKKARTPQKEHSDFRKKVKIRLLEMDKTQKWLIEEVTKRTGLYCDTAVLSKIFNDVMPAKKIVAAINEILDLPTENDEVRGEDAV